MNICFVTPELTPYAKVGGLADVSTALPAALASQGVDVRVFLPFYREIEIASDDLQRLPELNDVKLEFGGRVLNFDGYLAPFPGNDGISEGPQLILVDCPQLYDRPGIYGEEPDEFLRFLFLSRAAIASCQQLGWKPDVIHCNDWQTAMIPLLLRTLYKWDSLFETTRSVLTIHNIGHQGVFSSSVLPFLNLGENQHWLHQDDLRDQIVNYLKTGIMYADALTVVSPTYAREIQTTDYGMGLESILASRHSDIYGILNGIDPEEWNPEIDRLIPHQFSSNNLDGKRKNKEELLSQMGLRFDPTVPVAGIVSRLTAQKGFELLFDSMPEILSNRTCQLVVLGSGAETYVDFFTKLKRSFPEQVGFYHGFSNELAHLVEAGSDMFLMPSRYEPCGLNQMYSQAYGTVPIVRKTGGLADTVDQYDPSTGEGTGFVFEHFTSEGFGWALNFALNVFERPEEWKQIMRNGMARDFSWSVQSENYLKLYKHISPIKSTS